jgi:hypothetical protein
MFKIRIRKGELVNIQQGTRALHLLAVLAGSWSNEHQLQLAIHMFIQILFGMYCTPTITEAEFLNAIGTKVFRVFHLYSLALR